MAAIRQSHRTVANMEKQQQQQRGKEQTQQQTPSVSIVAVIERYRGTRIGTKNIYKMTDKTTRRRGGISKKTLLIKAIPIKHLIAPPPESREEKVAQKKLPKDVVEVCVTYRSSKMGTEKIYSLYDKTTRYRDGSVKTTLIARSTAIADLIGPDPKPR